MSVDGLGLPMMAAASFVGALAFGILFRTPPRYLLHATAIGFIASMGVRLTPEHWPMGFWSFMVALVVGGLSHVLARFTRRPAQTFLIPGVIFLVPGTYVYRAFAAALKNEQGAFTLALEAVTISLGISFALLLANWLVPSRRDL